MCIRDRGFQMAHNGHPNMAAHGLGGGMGGRHMLMSLADAGNVNLNL